MIVPLYLKNPEDGIATFDKIEIFYSNDSYASVYLTADIDITTRSLYGPGYTLKLDTNGNNYSYKARFKNSISGLVSGFTDIIATGESYSITEVRRLMDDEVSASYLFTTADLQKAEQRAVNRLFPRILRDIKDTSLTIVVDQLDYDLPVGIFRITRIDKGTKAADNLAEISTFEILVGKTLRLSETDVTEALPLTIYAKGKYRNSGEVPEMLQPVLIYEMLAECYETLANTRGVKFQAFQAQQKDTDVRPEVFKQLAQDARNTSKQILSDIDKG